MIFQGLFYISPRNLLSLLLVTCFFYSAAAAISISEDGQEGSATCQENFYRSQCLSHSNCRWCCDAPVGQQCMQTEEGSGEAANDHSLLHLESQLGVKQPVGLRGGECSEGALLSSPSETCEDLCRQAGNNCTSCEERAWCMFCADKTGSSMSDLTGLCQSPVDSCWSGRSTQQCHTLLEREPPVFLVLFKYYVERLSLSFFAICGLGLVTGALLVCGRFVAQGLPLWWEQVRSMLERLVSVNDPEADPLVDEPNPDNDIILPDEGHNAANSEAVSAAVQGPKEECASPNPSPSAGVELELSLCCLCFEAPATVTYLPCHHTCCCEYCSNRLCPNQQRQRFIPCPLCRQQIEAMVSLVNVFPVSGGS